MAANEKDVMNQDIAIISARIAERQTSIDNYNAMIATLQAQNDSDQCRIKVCNAYIKTLK